MKTDELIAGLAQDAQPAVPHPRASLMRAILASAPIALALMMLTLGLREDMAEAAGDGWFLLKLALVACAGGIAVKLTLAIAEPGRRIALALALAVPALLALAVMLDLGAMGLDDWRARLFGESAVVCLISIPLLSIAPLAGIVWALRDGAPDNAAAAGAIAGLLAGSIGAFAYGLHCSDDSPLFLAVWYVAGIGIVMLAGALLGRRYLAW